MGGNPGIADPSFTMKQIKDIRNSCVNRIRTRKIHCEQLLENTTAFNKLRSEIL
jgi:hypothetical protein